MLEVDRARWAGNWKLGQRQQSISGSLRLVVEDVEARTGSAER